MPTSGGSSSAISLIYTGPVGVYRPAQSSFIDALFNRPASTVPQKEIASIQAMQENFDTADSGAKHHMVYLLALAGFVGGIKDPEDAAEFAKTSSAKDASEIYASFLEEAGRRFKMGQRVTPEYVLRSMLEYRLGNAFNGNLDSLKIKNAANLTQALGGTLGTDDEPFTGTKTTTQKSVDLMSPKDAKGLVRGMLQQELGRDPTQAEYEDFIATVHAAEKSNPTISRTSTTYDEGEAISSRTRTSGGLGAAGAQQVLYDKLRKQPSWGEWQAMGVYGPALMEALGSAVPGV